MAPSSQTWAAAAGAAFACTLLPKAFVPSGPVAGPAAQPGEAELRLGLAAPATAAGSEQATGLGLAASAAGGIAVLALAARRRGVAPRQAADVVVDLERAGGVARRAFDTEQGATLPFKYWDPLGMSADGAQDTFRRRRIAEIKNGRVAMIACIGYIVPEYFRWPGYLSPSANLKFVDLPNGVAALSKMPADGWAQIGVFIAFLELFPLRQEPDRAPGDTTFCGKLGIPFTGSVSDPVKNGRSLDAEINNGRLAMVAITGMVWQNGFIGTTGPEMWFPRGAFEGELGVQAPVGFWDPLGLASDGDVNTFKRRRAVELKHGRISMLACIGYIVPEYAKFPGYVSPSLGLKFADVPSGLGALSKVPIEGLLQIALFLGHYEGFFWRQDPARAPGDYEGYGFLGIGNNFIFSFTAPTIDDPDARQKKLSAELANGRLAMVAIIGMFYQDGLTGSAWGDWSLYTSSPLR